MEPYFSLKVTTAGIRGIVGKSLTPQMITSFSSAFGAYCGTGPIVIATDAKVSAEMVKQAVLAGLLSVGSSPIDLGTSPIPTLMHYVRTSRSFGGIYISSGQQRKEWNALRFIGPDGMTLRPNQALELIDLFHQGVFPRVSAADIPEGKEEPNAFLSHREKILSAINLQAIRERKLTVAVDCNHGAASLFAPAFLEHMGCKVSALHTELENDPDTDDDSSPDSLDALCRLVNDRHADIGFSLDSDADRLMVVGSAGEPLGEDATVALAIRHILQKEPGPVVVDVACSRIVDDIAQQFRSPVFRTPVGEFHIVERMAACRSQIGGEGTGGVIAPAINPCRDGFVGMALLLEALAAENYSSKELIAQFPRYAMVKEKLDFLSREIPGALRRVKQHFSHEVQDTTDGLKILWPDRWLLVRASSSESAIRVIAEASTSQMAQSLSQQAMECLRPSL